MLPQTRHLSFPLFGLLLFVALAAVLTPGVGARESEDFALRQAFPEIAARVLDREEPFVAGAEGFVPRSSVTNRPAERSRRRPHARLPHRGDGAVRFTLDGGFEAVVREVGATGHGTMVEDAVAYRRSGGMSFWTTEQDGYEEWLCLEPDAVVRNRPVVTWEVEGAILHERGDAVELAGPNGVAQLRVTAPEAYAASGRPVETRLAARGATIELWVDAEGEAVLVDPAWTVVGAMSSPRQRHTATLLHDGRVLVIGGYAVDFFNPLDSAEIYDPASGSFQRATSMQAPRVEHTATLLDDGRVLVTGGSHNGEQVVLSSVEIYDPALDTWTTAAALQEARGGHAAARLVDGRVLVTGGRGNSREQLDTAELYDPTLDVWTPVSPMSEARQNHTATLLPDSRVLIVGGDIEGDHPVALAEIFDPVAGIFEPAGSLGLARTGHAAQALPDGRVLIVGGAALIDGTFSGQGSVEVYDPANGGGFRPTGDMLFARSWPTATLLPSGRVLVTGGVSNFTWDSAEIYEPAAGGYWRPAGHMSERRVMHTATLLHDGRVLVVGGKTDIVDAGGEALASSEIWDATLTGSWSPAGEMSVARDEHTATLLNDGRVLVAGGRIGSEFLDTAELYEPASGQWMPAGSLRSARASHTATLLPDGRVILLGGLATGCCGEQAVASAEVFNPEDGSWKEMGLPARGRHTATRIDDSFQILLVGGTHGSAGGLEDVLLFNAENGTMAGVQPLDFPLVYHTATRVPGVGVLLAGGGNFGPQADVEAYDAQGVNARSLTPMIASRMLFTATLLKSGMVLMAGGASRVTSAGAPEGPLSSAELYDPTGGGNAGPTGDMGHPRFLHTATLLKGGRVLVVGGADDRSAAQATAEISDTLGRSWAPIKSLSTARLRHTATLLQDGRVLVVGGRGGVAEGRYLASAEIFSLESEGIPCLSPGDCQSGYCTDGVCCDSACGRGSCDACSVAAGAPKDGVCTERIQCSPFKLDEVSCGSPAPRCKTTCASNSDCVRGFVCDPSNQCIPFVPTAPDEPAKPDESASARDESGGCDCRLAGGRAASAERGHVGPGLLLLTAAAAFRRRRRRGDRGDPAAAP